MSAEFPCPCCGYLVFHDPPGSHAVCPICVWEDDAVQLRWPLWNKGSNTPSLVAAQRCFAECGAVEPRLVPYARKPETSDLRDKRWRPLDPAHDAVEHDASSDSWPDDFTDLYYWRGTYWRRRVSESFVGELTSSRRRAVGS